MGALVMFGIYAGYGTYAEKSARNDAEVFCNAVNLGVSSEGLLALAISSGANATATRWIKGEWQPDWLPVTFVRLKGPGLLSEPFNPALIPFNEPAS
jgi:hypothetical protein